MPVAYSEHRAYDSLRRIIRTYIVTVEVKHRTVTVKGKRGTLVKSFNHVNVEMTMVGAKRLRIDLWFGNRKVMQPQI